LAAIGLYAYVGANGWVFLALLFVPDVAMVGYLANPRVGSWLYNAAHTVSLPLIVGLVGLVTPTALLPIALIWCAHIGMDRALGYGLKYPTAFQDTHLQRV
jgi:hypothetical protein